jgi:hypothetical protein
MRLGYVSSGIAALVAVTGANAQQSSRPSTAGHSVQQDFDAATALAQGTDHAAALAAWQALEKRVSNNRRTRSIVLLRESVELLALDRDQEASAAAREGLAGLPANDETLHDDRIKGYLTLGRVSESALDYASAADFYRQAEGVAETLPEKVDVLLSLIETETFTDPAAAAAAVTRIDAVLATAQADKTVQAMVAQRKDRLLLNTGDIAGARKESMKAVQLLGGLTLKTDSNDVSARSDVALAAMLLGDTETARQYMAMTGAGRLDKGSFDPGVQMKAPECGGEAGLKPQDMAVVEFSIADDGTVFAATPIYAAGGGAVALEFARAARRWSWTADQVKNLPRFFRYRARVEMRCSTEFERPSIRDMLDGALAAWLAGQGIAVAPESTGLDAADLPAQRAALDSAAAKDGGNGLQTLAALRVLLANRVLPGDEKNAMARHALAIADAKGAPPLARLSIDLVEHATDVTEDRHTDWRDNYADALMPAYAHDPRAHAALDLLSADVTARRHKDQSRALLQQVADDAALKANDPLRVGALVRIASLDQQAGDDDAARAAFAKSGLAADQCAIIDSPPKLLSVNTASEFPREAMLWGFEGWTQMQFDIDANGKVINDRAILSYPPFVFTKAGVSTIDGARYSKSYRPDGGLGCGGSTNRVRFVLPNH